MEMLCLIIVYMLTIDLCQLRAADHDKLRNNVQKNRKIKVLNGYDDHVCYFFLLLLSFAISLDPDQTSGLIWIQFFDTLIMFLKELFEKVNF